MLSQYLFVVLIKIIFKNIKRPIKLWDTAGIRRKSRVSEKLEKLSVADALRAVKFAEIVVLLIDADTPFDKQDVQLADLVEREGRAMVIAINKWDLKLDRNEIREIANESYDQVDNVLKNAPHTAFQAIDENWNHKYSFTRLGNVLSH